jgi:hypothetical protein
MMFLHDHADLCPVTKARSMAINDTALSTDVRQGILTELDGFGDDEVESCTCGRVMVETWRALSVALTLYAEGVEENLADDGIEDAPIADDLHADARRLFTGDLPVHAHTWEVLADETGALAYIESAAALHTVKRWVAENRPQVDR